MEQPVFFGYGACPDFYQKFNSKARDPKKVPTEKSGLKAEAKDGSTYKIKYNLLMVTHPAALPPPLTPGFRLKTMPE